MKMNILAVAVALPDRDLLARIAVLAAHERTATAELVAHLAALRLRPSLYAAQGYGSLFAYCRHALRLSEDAASNRIHAARACLKFPVILDLLASGELSLSAVRMLRRHLTMENHERVLGRARNARRADVERLVAELAPRPDVPSSVRKASQPKTSEPQPSVVGQAAQPELPAVVMGASDPMPGASSPMPAVRPAAPCVPRPVVQPLSPERYRVQFTIGQDAHDILRRLQTLLRREIPDGDAGGIFERALRLLHEEVEAAKFGRATKRGSAARRLPESCQDRARHDPTAIAERAAHEAILITSATASAFENRIRPGADGSGTSSTTLSVTRAMDPPQTMDPPQVRSAASARSRYIPKAVKRAVWYRDRGQCAFVSASGQRCVEREFLELHHIQPYALKGPATAANIALRCRHHNVYEAEVVFGVRAMPSLWPERTSRAAR
jgi:hypothetical protein